MIAACQQFRARNNTNTRLSLFVTTKPAIEDCTNFQLGCFNFDYTGMLGKYYKQFNNLTDTFHSAELNIWDNQWSEYNLFSGQNVVFFNAFNDTAFLNEFKQKVQVDQEVAEKNFSSVPFTHGLSFDYKDSSNYVKLWCNFRIVQ